MKLPRIVLLASLILGAALAVPVRDPVRLVRIDKGTPALATLLRSRGLDVVQELHGRLRVRAFQQFEEKQKVVIEADELAAGERPPN